ncbi:MAG: hypothetical protein WA126_09060 [Thermodesulfovibrionales bacterium]
MHRKKGKTSQMGGHHQIRVENLSDLILNGKYMSVRLNNLLLNTPLQSAYTESIKSFNLLEVIYHNLWTYRLNTYTSSSHLMIDSEGFQHEGDGCNYHEYTRLVKKEGRKYKYKEVSFPWPQLQLESGAKTKGWIWFDVLDNETSM